eukprot:752613-Hanusia_phi.AAC.2
MSRSHRSPLAAKQPLVRYELQLVELGSDVETNKQNTQMSQSRKQATERESFQSSSLFTKSNKQLRLSTAPQHVQRDVEVSLKAAIAAAKHHAERAASEGRLSEALRRREDVVSRGDQVKERTLGETCSGQVRKERVRRKRNAGVRSPAPAGVGSIRSGGNREVSVDHDAGAAAVSILQGKAAFPGEERWVASRQYDTFDQLGNILLGLGNCHGALKNFASAHKSYDLARKVKNLLRGANMIIIMLVCKMLDEQVGRESEAVPSILVNKVKLYWIVEGMC